MDACSATGDFFTLICLQSALCSFIRTSTGLPVSITYLFPQPHSIKYTPVSTLLHCGARLINTFSSLLLYWKTVLMSFCFKTRLIDSSRPRTYGIVTQLIGFVLLSFLSGGAGQTDLRKLRSMAHLETRYPLKHCELCYIALVVEPPPNITPAHV